MTDSVKPIPAASGSLVNALQASNPLATMEAAIPQEHRNVLTRMGVSGSDQPATQVMASAVISRPMIPAKPVIQRGDIMKTKDGKRVTVLECSIGKLNNGAPIHKVVHNKTGEILYLPEKKLKPWEPRQV